MSKRTRRPPGFYASLLRGISWNEDILNSKRSSNADHSVLGWEMVTVTVVLKSMLSTNKIAFILVVMVIL